MLGVAVRRSGVWTYGILNLFHILGVSTLFGSILILDLRLLGWLRRGTIAELALVTIPLARIGFIVAAMAGITMLSTNGPDYVGNPFLLIKFPAILAGLLNAAVISRLPAWRACGHRELSAHERRQLAVMGGISLVCWTTALSAGRMIGYW